MIQGVNTIGGKVSIASVNRAEGPGCLRPQRGFWGRSSLSKFLSSKEHLDGLKIDLNAAETITVQDYKKTPTKTNMNGSTHIQC